MQKIYFHALFLTIFFGQVARAQSPKLTSFSPTVGPTGTLVTIDGTNLNTPTSLKIGGVAAVIISNTGVKITAMVMPGAVTGVISIGTAQGQATSPSNFTVTTAKSPNSQQGAKLMGDGTGGAQELEGASVAISADGNTAAFGDIGNNNTGCVWVFVREKGLWKQQAQLVGTGYVTNGGYLSQGTSVSISADGNTIAEGDPEDNGELGAVWVFTRDANNNWTQAGNKLVGTGAVIKRNSNNGVWQGQSVAISADGTTLIEGGYNDNGGKGAAWVFTRTNSTWTQSGNKLVGVGAIDGTTTGGAWQGYSVAIDATGSTAVIGGNNDSSGFGATWVFVNSGGKWVQQGNKIVGTGAVNTAGYGPQQGYSVAISADGNTVMEGGYGDDNYNGAAWVFTRSNAVWSQQGDKLTLTDVMAGGHKAQFGIAVSLSADGNSAIIGATGDGQISINDSLSGGDAAYVFTRSSGVWTQQNSKLYGADETVVNFNGNLVRASQGYAVALSADGNTAIVSGLTDSLESGACWVFTNAFVPPPVISSFTPANGPVGSLVTITGTTTLGDNLTLNPVNIGNIPGLQIANTGTKLTFMVMPATTSGKVTLTTGGGTNTSSGVFTATASKIPDVQQGNKLVGTGVEGSASYQGNAVAISTDGNTAVIGAPGDNNSVGAIWIFTRNNGVWQQQGTKLVGSGYIGNGGQGTSVAISADGNTIVEGANNDNGGVGAAWVFVRTNGVWNQQGAKLVGSNAIGAAHQGTAVAISGDGNRILISGAYDNTYAGAVWFFSRSNNSWQLKQKIAPTSSYTYFGSSLALSADGRTAAIGGIYLFTGDLKNTGGVFVCYFNNGMWVTYDPPLIGTGYVGGDGTNVIKQGQSVAINADGTTLISGAPNDSLQQGAAWVFVKSNGTWQQQGNKLVGRGQGPSPIGEFQGYSVGISADGNTAIISGSGDNNFEGAAWIFKRTGTTWVQQGKKLVGKDTSGTGGYQGASVAISGDGNTAVSGGSGDDNGIGATWIFTNSATLPVTFKNFDAYIIGKGVQTTWTGFDETNISGYDVERSGTGFQFARIGHVAAKANAAVNNYSWFDAVPLSGDNFYRIKAINKDGSSEYSNIVKVSLGSEKSNMQVYPNPITGKTIQVRLTNVAAGSYTLTMYNMNGQTLLTQHYQHTGGSASITLNAPGLAAGLYSIQMKGNNTYRTSVLVL